MEVVDTAAVRVAACQVALANACLVAVFVVFAEVAASRSSTMTCNTKQEPFPVFAAMIFPYTGPVKRLNRWGYALKSYLVEVHSQGPRADLEIRRSWPVNTERRRMWNQRVPWPVGCGGDCSASDGFRLG